MKTILLLLFFSTALQAAIVNSDDRHEIIDSPLKIQEIAKSIAALIPKDRVEKLKNGDYKLSGLNYVKDLNFCKDERFVNTQKLIANCSASLIGPDKIATAAHCIDERVGFSIESYYIVFDYVESENSDNLILSKNSVYEIESMPQYTFDFPKDKDVAILKLKRSVKDRAPLKLSKARVELGEELFMLGFPFGLPMKYHDNGYVTDSSTFLNGNSSFTHDLDSFSVNSGSAIFSASTREIVGILVRGTGPNYQLDKEKNCNIWGYGDNYFGEGNYIDLLEL